MSSPPRSRRLLSGSISTSRSRSLAESASSLATEQKDADVVGSMLDSDGQYLSTTFLQFIINIQNHCPRDQIADIKI